METLNEQPDPDGFATRKARLKQVVSEALGSVKSPLGSFFDASLLLVNLAACAVYVAHTYYEDGLAGQILTIAEWIFALLFSIEYAGRLWISNRKWSYVFSIYGLVDLLSILPIFFRSTGGGFMRAFRVLRVFRFTRLLKDRHFFFGDISEFGLQIVRVFFTIFAILFTAAGLIHAVESRDPNAMIHTFGDAFYYTVITLTTVGFGDITPVTEAGRWATVIMIFCGIVFIPWQTGILIRLLLRDSQHKKEVICKGCGLTHHDHDASHCKACGKIIYQEYEGDL